MTTGPDAPMQVTTIETPSLGDRSYVISAGDVAVVIDPQRDIDRVVAVTDRLDTRITHVFETHIHNDYVSGGLELARWAGAAYCVNAAEEVNYDRSGVGSGDTVASGAMRWRVLATPGHTPGHLAFVLGGDGSDAAVFTGGSLLYGTVGRTDLISAEQTEPLTRAQYRSARSLLETLPAHTAVYPTHGFGSFCASTTTADDPVQVGEDTSTIGAQRLVNLVAGTDDEDAFVAALIAGFGQYPTYYAHMGPENRRGPEPLDLAPLRPVDEAEIARRIEQGEWVLDLRNRTAFAADHRVGTVGTELGDSFATYVGWTIPWGAPLTLIGDAPDVAAAQRELARIGIPRPQGAAPYVSSPANHRAYPVAAFRDLGAAADGIAVLDVRRPEEWAEERVAGSINIPLHELESRMDEVPDKEIWVYCRTGYRASVACSMLERSGRSVVLIDDLVESASAAGLAIAT